MLVRPSAVSDLFASLGLLLDASILFQKRAFTLSIDGRHQRIFGVVFSQHTCRPSRLAQVKTPSVLLGS